MEYEFDEEAEQMQGKLATDQIDKDDDEGMKDEDKDKPQAPEDNQNEQAQDQNDHESIDEDDGV